MLNIGLSSNNIIEFGPFHITDAVLAGFASTLITIILIIIGVKGAKLIPGRLQSAFEMAVEIFMDFLKIAFGTEKRARKYLPFFLTFLIYLMVANQFSLFPLLSNFIVSPGEYVFKSPTMDYSQSIALGLIAVFTANIVAFAVAPIGHIGSFFRLGAFLKIRKPTDIGNAILEVFLGILDLISEISRIISLSSRLFGNMYATGLMVYVISYLSIYTAYVLPIPFIVINAFSSVVQAFVFPILSLNFMAGTVNKHIDMDKLIKEDEQKKEGLKELTLKPELAKVS